MYHLVDPKEGNAIIRTYQVDAAEAVKEGDFIMVSKQIFNAFKKDPKMDVKKAIAKESENSAPAGDVGSDAKQAAKALQAEKKEILKKMVEEINASDGAKAEGLKVNGKSGEQKIRDLHAKHCASNTLDDGTEKNTEE